MANEKKNVWGINYTLLEAKTDKDWKTAGRKTLYQVGIGVAGGAFGTVLAGKHSLPIGLALMYAGNMWKEATALNAIGIGMVTASLLQPPGDTTIKQRWETLSSNFMSQTYLDKVFKGSSTSKNTAKENTQENTTESENPVGSVTEGNNTLDELDQQLVASAMAYNESQGGKTMAGYGSNYTDVDFSGM